MEKDQIIRMALEAGLHRQQHNLMSNPVQHRFSYNGYEENLERFVALVAAAEREACAIAAWSTGMDLHMKQGDAREIGSACARAIRARSNT